jgi:uncharacterized delta-60 repeat protein
VTAVVRYNQNGSFDTTFNPNGTIEGLDVPLAQLLEGTFSVVPPSLPPEGRAFGVHPGIVITYIGNAAVANDVKIDNDNHIVVAGFARGSQETSIALVRYLDNGSLDTTFNPTASFTGPGGAILEARSGILTPNFARDQLGLRPGIVLTSINIYQDIVRSILIDNNNKIVATGFSSNGNNNRFATLRYNPNGSLDSTFGGNGIVVTDIFTGQVVDHIINDNEAYFVALDSTNKLLVTGFSSDGTEDNFTTARYNNNGTLDHTFNPSGNDFFRPQSNIFDVTLTPGFFITNQLLFEAFHPGIVITHIVYGQPVHTLPLYGVNDPLLIPALTYGVPTVVETLVNPDLFLEAPAVSAQDTGGDILTNSRQPALRGTAAPASLVTLVINDDITVQAPVEGNGSWKVSLPSLADGTYKIAGTNILGESAKPMAPITLTVDTSIPAQPVITSPANNELVTTSACTVKGTAEPFMRIKLYVNTRIYAELDTDSAGKWDTSGAPIQLVDGRYTFYAQAVNKAGTTSEPSQKVTCTVDTKPPVVPKIISPAAKSTLRSSIIMLKGTAKPFVPLTVYINKKQVGTAKTDAGGTWSYRARLANGTYIIQVKAQDPASDTPVSSADTRITVNRQARSQARANNKKNVPAKTNFISSRNTNATVVAGRAAPGSSIQVFLDNRLVGTTRVNARGRWRYLVYNNMPRSPGVNKISIMTTSQDGKTKSLGSLNITK